ncbi:MAG: 3-oxoacyl-ACP reductase FabG [Dehalococcoidales bacterium]|nr:MAG: 3-oxoacyl-ACP reductase FabG [Dehalococcoidales bacterium]
MTLPSLSLEGRIALVTGGKRGIGKAIALVLAEAGADVAIADYIIDDGELKAVAEEIGGLGRRCLAVQSDVSQKSEVEELVKRVESELGVIDILVNNAGISGLEIRSEIPDEHWQKVIDVNLNGCYLCSQEVSQRMVERKKGNIINIASVEGLRGGVLPKALAPMIPVPTVPTGPTLVGQPYNVSKAGIIMLTRVMARQLGSYGIRVNAIAPGGIRTEMIRFIWDNADFMKQLETQVPLGRIGETSEIASVALFLASDASSYVTGHTLVADGGLLA